VLNAYPQNFFSLLNKNNTPSDFFTLKFSAPNQLKISYVEIVEDKLVAKEIILTGKRKKKFFEVYFSKKQFFIPFLYGNFNIYRLRIGLDESGNIVVRNFSDFSGNVLFIGGGYNGETKSIFEKVENSAAAIPFSEDGKWGFKKKDEIIIQPVFDLVRAFDGNCARVCKNKKWGLIDAQGKYLSEIMYDSIRPIHSYKDALQYNFVYLDGKKGIITTDGQVTVPVIYDDIKNNGEFFELKMGGKIGLCTPEKIIIPAIYETLSYFIYHQYNYAEATRNGSIYFVDKNGFEYETMANPYYSKIGFLENGQPKYIPNLASKRKIVVQIENQDQ